MGHSARRQGGETTVQLEKERMEWNREGWGLGGIPEGPVYNPTGESIILPP